MIAQLFGCIAQIFGSTCIAKLFGMVAQIIDRVTQQLQGNTNNWLQPITLTEYLFYSTKELGAGQVMLD